MIKTVHIREKFPILLQKVNNKTLVYFDNAATTHKPQSVIDSITNFYKHENSNVHRATHFLSSIATEKMEATRKKVQKLINANHTHEIIFTSGTTDAVNMVATTFAEKFLRNGDQIMVSAFEHHSNIVPWQIAAKRKGAFVNALPLDSNGDISWDKLEGHFERVKLFAITHVSNATGKVFPIKKLIKKAHQHNIPVLIDAAQSIAHFMTDVIDLDCDFFCFSGHKMYGPTGTGILYGKEQWLDKLPPYKGGGEMIREVDIDRSTFNELPFKFEAGTPNIAGNIALAAAIDFLLETGIENISSYENKLLSFALSELKKIQDIQIFGQDKPGGSIVSFNIEGVHPSDIGMLLDQHGIAIRTGHHCCQPLMKFYNIHGTVRASFAVYNQESEINTFVEALNKVIKMIK